MNITLRQVEAFLTVANLRSFTAAGKSMHITQGAVSGLIRELESHVGVPLFDRTSRMVTLSPDGEKFLPVAQKAFQEFEMTERFAADLKQMRSGVLRIVGAPLMACTLLPLYIARFARVAPDIRVELIDEVPPGVQHSILNGDAMLGFGPQRLLEQDIVSETLFATPVRMISRPDHPLAGRQIEWDDVKKEPLILIGRESISWIASDVGGKTSFTVTHVVSQMSTAFGLVAAGQGIVVAGPFSMLLAKGYGLTCTPVSNPVFTRNMMLYYHKSRKLSVPAILFLSFLREYVAQNPPNTIIDATVADIAMRG